MTALPMQPELRAYPMMETIPPGHFAMKMEDSRMEPHIYQGECAVIDTGAREIEWGEVHLVLQSDGPRLWHIVRSPKWMDLSDCGYLTILNQPRRIVGPDGRDTLDFSKPVHVSDGAMYLHALEPKIVGRVVGIYQTERFRERRRRWSR